MIRVLHYGLSTNKGGIETYLRKLWNNIDRNKYHFSFLDMTGEGNTPCFCDELKQSGCDFYKITPRSVSLTKNKKELEQLFQQQHFDVLHFHVNTLSYVTPVLTALRNGCRVIVHSRSAGSSKRLITRTLHHWNKFRLRKTDITRIGVSVPATEWLFGSDMPSAVYNNGIEISKFKFREADRMNIRKELACENYLVIGNVGAFLPAKNHRFLIDVFAQVCTRRNDAVLWLVGRGPGKPEIEQYVHRKGLSDKVQFLGSREDMPQVYAGMDVFFLPSLFEGFPNAMLEAQCAGLPCLQSDCITEEVLIADNATNFSLTESADAWADVLLMVTQRKYADRQLGALCLENAGFSVRQEILRIEKLYENVVGLKTEVDK